MLIKDILTINLADDIKNVIDLEDLSESEIQSEIENYIVTNGLAAEYSNFVSAFTSNIKESGVWISGFYGSGKSYFGKMLGYLISNRMIAGTPARDRILQRFTGIEEEALIKNNIRRLDSVNSRVVFLDIAKQDTSKGLSYTLFRNFLKTLELPQNEHGYLLYHLMISENFSNVADYMYENTGINWSDIKDRLLEYTKVIKNIYIQKGNTEDDYKNMLETIRREIDQFSASILKEELNNYFSIEKNEKIVFLFDEASEAINQQKFTLLDLEGLCEALSSLGGKVWTIAIAQEKLDDVINNSNISKAQLSKVTDRFKTKIHLESTEIDVIIRNRLLKKTDEGIALLKEHFQNNAGKIADHASLTGAGISKTNNADNYATYYPFYKYQFDLLQNFLFGTKGYASTKVAARGMIITTYDLLTKELQNKPLFEVSTGWQICKQAQPSPHISLVSRYTNAERILEQDNIPVSGRKLLETINFLSEAEVVPTTLPNIVKSFISDPEKFYKVHDTIAKALDRLTEAKVLLDSNKTYRITSDIEERLLDEMNSFTVQGFVKKKQVVAAYKSADFIKSTAKITDNGIQYNFYITTDNDDELTNPSLKYLKAKLKSIYSISDDRNNDIETLKSQHQNDKDLIWIVPDNRSFRELDRLIDEVERIGYLEEKYNNPNSEEGKIMLNFSTAKAEKQNRIAVLIEESLKNATAIYLYNTFQLNADNWQTIMQGQQRQIIQNVYSKRLSAQLSENVAVSVVKETNNARLQQYFNKADFQFFDAQGNFIGNNLKVVEEVIYKIRNTFVDGATLEKELELPPTGYTLGTVISAVAVLLRAGKIIAKYNGEVIYSWKDSKVVALFSAAREFRKASFKQISKSLSASQKQEITQFLLDIEAAKYINRKIDYNTNDFELANAIRELSKHFTEKVETFKAVEKDFEKLFPAIEFHKDTLLGFIGAVSEANYIDKANEFLAQKNSFHDAVQAIEKVEKFIRDNLPRVKEWKAFVAAVADELKKAGRSNEIIEQKILEFNKLMKSDVVENFPSLQQVTQKIKDEYHKLFTDAIRILSEKYSTLKIDAENLIKEINSLPADLNKQALADAEAMLQYASQRTQNFILLDFDVKDKQSRFTYSEVLSYIELYDIKSNELAIIQAGLIREAPITEQTATDTAINQVLEAFPLAPKRIISSLPGKVVKVANYRNWLKQELKKIAPLSDNDEIEIN